jgi:hypothetical protein
MRVEPDSKGSHPAMHAVKFSLYFFTVRANGYFHVSNLAQTKCISIQNHSASNLLPTRNREYLHESRVFILLTERGFNPII